MRPKGSTKERLAIYERQYQLLMLKLSTDKSLRSQTRLKLARAFALLYLTGCRVSEIARLSYDDIMAIKSDFTLALNNENKTKQARTIFFIPKMVELLFMNDFGDALAHGGYLFYEPSGLKPMSKKGLTQLINKYLARYLGELYTTHSFRAGYITRTVEATGNLKTAQDLVGHKSIKTTLNYLSTSSEQKIKALEAVFSRSEL